MEDVTVSRSRPSSPQMAMGEGSDTCPETYSRWQLWMGGVFVATAASMAWITLASFLDVNRFSTGWFAGAIAATIYGFGHRATFRKPGAGA